MLRQHRTRRLGLLRRSLTVEALEDRTLLNGVVTASLDPSGLLRITGDAADNQFTMAPSPTPGQIRIAGNAGTATTINQDAFADFPLAAITDIQMMLGGGQDNVTATGFSIPGALTLYYGNSADFVDLPTCGANTINLLFADPAAGDLGSGDNGVLLPTQLLSGFNLTGVTASELNLVTGPDTAAVSLSASTIGTARIVTPSDGHDRITVTGSTIGNLQVLAGDDTIIVAGSQLTQATIIATGSSGIVLASDTFTSAAAPASLKVAAGIAGPNTQSVTLIDLAFHTEADFLDDTSLWVIVGDATAGDNPGLSMLSMSQITGVGNTKVKVGRNFESVVLDTLSVFGSLNVTVGDNAQHVQLSNFNTLWDVNLTLGNGAQAVTLDTFFVLLGALTITNGDGNTTFKIDNGTIWDSLVLITGDGHNTIQLDTLSVQYLFVQAATGTNLVAAHNVKSESLFSLIYGGSGEANTFWDQGGNAGFSVFGFDNFLTGSS